MIFDEAMELSECPELIDLMDISYGGQARMREATVGLQSVSLNERPPPYHEIQPATNPYLWYA